MNIGENRIRSAVSGRGIGRGYAVGQLRFIKKKTIGVGRERRECGADEERAKLRSALDKAALELDALYQKTLREAGESEAQIFEIHRMIIDDEDLFDEAESMILDGYSASYSVREASEKYGSVFASMDDEYLSARAADIRDVAARVIGILEGVSENTSEKTKENEKYIVVADDLTPSETIQLNRSEILGFVTFFGSPNSHTAILARALGIPALIGTGNIPDSCDGAIAVIDADKGLLYIDPDTELLKNYEATIRREAEKKERFDSLRGKPSMTKSGREIRIYANIGGADEAALALENDAEGIGLLRSEFLYLGSDKCPDEEVLFKAYRRTAETMGEREVIIRTFDIGADKKIGYFGLSEEENPAMGLRGIRLALSRPEIFKTQLRAICRASAYGRIAIMLPMIVAAEEIRAAKRLICEVQRELEREEKAFDREMKVGIMIETPAAAVMSDVLAHEADFFSVGTNDLIQYTLAADRQNPDVAEICDRVREPVMRLIALVTKNSHNARIWTGICGELASDTSLTERFVEMGVDELSVSPPYILPLRDKVRECK